MWVRVGGGMESVPDRKRHGPADTAFPPPGGPWEPLALGGHLVGWAERGGLATARRSAEMGARIAEEERTHLVGRLGHKLRSAVLALQESARQAAFGRPELMETVFEQAQEVGRRAAALEAAANAPKERPRGVVLGAVLNGAMPFATRRMPDDAAVLGSEPAPLPVPEMGEPLIRLIVDTHLNGWLDVGSDGCADVYLPAYAGR